MRRRRLLIWLLGVWLAGWGPLPVHADSLHLRCPPRDSARERTLGVLTQSYGPFRRYVPDLLHACGACFEIPAGYASYLQQAPDAVKVAHLRLSIPLHQFPRHCDSWVWPEATPPTWEKWRVMLEPLEWGRHWTLSGEACP